jgi:outer membrane protein OmpA-like peptidoglycan-associated protein
VGYTIQKGKLSLDLHYTIEDKKLDAANEVLIDQFDFGEAVKSPVAVDLPVKLGVSLLKDRSGRIKLSLPVTGRLDDPQFSIAGIILKVLKNILIKAATSPFSLIGSLAGSHEDLSCVVFDPGSDRLSDAEKAKLDALARALADRPNLSMEISGSADPDADRQGLVDREFKKQLLAGKKGKKAEKEEPEAAGEPGAIAAEEYEKLLKKAYRAAKFEKPKNAVGLSKGLPAEEMEALMKKNITVTDDDLEALAKERAEAVKDYLAGPGNVAAARLFMVKPPGLAPQKRENLKNSRVDLKLK